ncbi:hypothetical protein N7931_15575 [Catenovulum sp. 2E275]|uniref:tetratricopeptide repeat protein n=1 Tax=Catenovulum sp. 2E275 TaxID=2980497 RepID=UPI0021CF30B7|nr:hypothetical protein [Catenovulum sp. 2E275]MCU4677053.1 hypothetical protein [Catenovulum sp. 2E275]
MKAKLISKSVSLLLAGYLFSHTSFAADITQADQYFQQKQYDLAKVDYLTLAETGSAHAFYQLGVLYLNGLGVEKSQLKALLWFDLAAEQSFLDSKQIVADLLKNTPDESKAKIQVLSDTFKQSYGWQVVHNRYFAVIDHNKISQKVYFAELDEQGNPHISDKQDFVDSVGIETNNDAVMGFDDSSLAEGEDIQSDFFFSRPTMQDIRSRPFYAVIDYEIARDGSSRNLELNQSVTETNQAYQEALADLSEHKSDAVPFFESDKTLFINRSYIGLASYTKAKIQNQYEDLYSWLFRKTRLWKRSEDLTDQYHYAMALSTFNWLDKDGKELDQVLDKLAKVGHPLAQFEYGLKLYREQTDIERGIFWISEAAKAGVSRAQYRLGRILLDSPWVKSDEHKALFWFENAADKAYVHAYLSVAELKLLAQDQTFTQC